jgi:hypothetical protein
MLYYLTSDGKKSPGYYYDKIRINTNLEVGALRTLVPEKFITNETRSYSINKTLPAVYKWGFKSKLEVVAPTMKCLNFLALSLRLARVKISYIEIAKDITTETRRAAEKRTYELLKTMRKMYCSEHSIFDQTLKNDVGKFRSDKTLFGTMTGYFGSKINKYAVYPRLSKISNDPCIHAEWRIKGAALIAKRTGIRSIQDLIKSDIRGLFEEKERRNIVHEKIDRHKLGKWLLSWEKRKQFSRRQQMRISIMSETFMSVYMIRTYADLVDILSKRKQGLKRRRGCKSKWQKKFISLKDYGKFRKRI